MYRNKLLTTKRALKFLGCLLPTSIIAIVMMSSSHAATDEIVGETSEISIASTIGLNDGKLSVSLKGIPLHWVIKEVSRQTGIDIQFVGERLSSKVDMQFDDSPVDNGLRLLLRDVNTIFVYADTVEGENSGGQLTKVFILPKGENGNFNDGKKQLVETLSGISQQIQGSIPQTYKDSNPYTSMNNPLIDQSLYELSETLSERILNAVRTPN